METMRIVNGNGIQRKKQLLEENVQNVSASDIVSREKCRILSLRSNQPQK